MKYNQFLELDELLENENFLFEAPAKEVGQLDTKKGNWFTRWGLMKNKLNKTAKRLQDQVIDKIVQKFLPTILETEVNTAQQIAELRRQQKQPKEIMKIMKANLGSVKKIQLQQIKATHEAINKFVESTAATLNKKIDNSKMNDKNKLNIKNYWLLLTTQIKMNAFQHMSDKINEGVQKVLGTDEDAKRFQRAASPNQQSVNQLLDEFKKLSKQKKDIVTADEASMQINDTPQDQTQPTETSTTEAPVKTPEVSQPGQLIIGKKYSIEYPAGKFYTAEIVKDKGDGSYTAYLDNQKETKYNLTKEMAATAKEIK